MTPPSFLTPGNSVIVRTVTHYHTGRVLSIDDRWLVLTEAAWIADTGRWSTCLTKGRLVEVEPFPDQVAINLAAIVDVAPWSHPLPQKVAP